MMAFLRLALVVIVVEGVLYLLLTTYLRSLHRESLEERWDAQNPDRPGPSAERDAAVEAGMAVYRRSLRARLLWVLLLVPVVAIALIIYIVNYTG